MITSEILNISILNLQNNLSQIKVVEDKGAIKDFKDIVNEKIDIKLNENLNIQDNTVDNLLKDLNELLSVINSSLQIASVSKKDTDQDKILLLPIMKNTQSIIVNETSNEVYGEDFNNSELLNKLFTKENELNSKDTQLLNRLVSINKEPNSNVAENLDTKVTSIKNKGLTELREVLTRLVTELNDRNQEESLKQNSKIFNKISNITKELEKIEPTQLDEISLEDLSSLKEIVVSSLDKVKTELDNILAVLSVIIEKLQSTVINKTSNESYGEDFNKSELLNKLFTEESKLNSKDTQFLKRLVLINNESNSNITENLSNTSNEDYVEASKNSELLNKLLTKRNELNSKDIQFLKRLVSINKEPNSNITENLDTKVTLIKNKELTELREVLTRLVTELNDRNQEESLKQNSKVFNEISNITKELEKIEPKQLEQVSLEDLSLIKEMVKSALSMTKGSQSKKPLKENLLSSNNDINVEYVDFAKANEYLKEDLSSNRLRLKLVKNQGNGEIGSVKDEIILNKNKEDSLLKKIISDSEKNNEHTLMFTQRFNEMKNINQVKNELVINKNTMLNDVVKTIKYMAENNERTLTVKMNPKDLGEITIKIVAQGESMKATITAASRDTAILLNANEMDIKKMLEAQGIKISEVNISLYNDDTTFFRDQAGFGRQNESHRQNQNQNRTVSNKELDDEKHNEALDNTNNINMFA